jgi:Tetratricopeptide repeat
MRKSFEECKDLFMQARQSANFNDMALWATELLQYDDQLCWVWANRGVALNKLGHPLDAILNYEKALSFDMEASERAILCSNTGAAYWDMYQGDRAMAHLHKAIEIEPMAQTYLTLGNIHKHQGDMQKAISAYRNSVAIDPNYGDGHLCLGMALLKVGNLKEGWAEYEWRWKTPQLPARKLKAPQWAGEDLTGKTILVYGEQGLGDIIQFARYVRVLAQRFPTSKIIAEGRQPVKRLLETIPEAYAVTNVGDPVPVTDYAVPMLTLAGMMTPDMKSIPNSKREFFLKPQDVANWGERFKELPSGIRVGVCWAGMARATDPNAAAIDAIRSTTLDQFAKLAIPSIVWVSLQKGPPAEQIKTPPRNMMIADYTDEMHDFYETCCAAANCDLVITVDTAVVHATASVGVPTWMLSRWDGCWRWFGDRNDSPWYPSLRQFVQPSHGDWDGMVANVASELRKFVASKNEPELNLTLAK